MHRAPLDNALHLTQAGSKREVWSAALRAVHHFVRSLVVARALVDDERMPAELTQTLASCVTDLFVVHCRPGTIINLARGLKAVDSEAVKLSDSVRQSSRLFTESLETVR